MDKCYAIAALAKNQEDAGSDFPPGSSFLEREFELSRRDSAEPVAGLDLTHPALVNT